MSVRELKSLSDGKVIACRTRSGRQDDRSKTNMSSQEEVSGGLEAQVSVRTDSRVQGGRGQSSEVKPRKGHP